MRINDTSKPPDNPVFMGTIGKWEYWIYPPEVQWPADVRTSRRYWNGREQAYVHARRLLLDNVEFDKAIKTAMKKANVYTYDEWIKLDAGVQTKSNGYTHSAWKPEDFAKYDILIKNTRWWKYWFSTYNFATAKAEVTIQIVKAGHNGKPSDMIDTLGVEAPQAAPPELQDTIDQYVENAIKASKKNITSKQETVDDINGLLTHMEVLMKLRDKIQGQINKQVTSIWG